MKVEFDGRTWQLDTEHIILRHALEIQEQTGLGILEWHEALMRARGEDGKLVHSQRTWLLSLAALYWLMLAQNGEDTDPDDLGDLDFAQFASAYIDARTAEFAARKAEAEPDPTSPPGPPDDPPSPPGSPTATTRTHRARPPVPTGSG